MATVPSDCLVVVASLFQPLQSLKLQPVFIQPSFKAAAFPSCVSVNSSNPTAACKEGVVRSPL